MLNKNVLFSWGPLKYKYIKQTPSFPFQRLSKPLLSPWFNHPMSCWQINHPNHSSFPSKLNPNASHPSTQTPHNSDPTYRANQLQPPCFHNICPYFNHTSALSLPRSIFGVFTVFHLKCPQRPATSRALAFLHPTKRSTHCFFNFQNGQYGRISDLMSLIT